MMYEPLHSVIIISSNIEKETMIKNKNAFDQTLPLHLILDQQHAKHECNECG